MFSDLDATLLALLGDPDAPAALREAEVSFDTPDKDFTPTQPTVDLFLHEVVENRALRDGTRQLERAGNRYRSSGSWLRLDCTYLATAWSAQAAGLKAQEEHRLLGLALRWLGRFPVVEDRFLQGALRAPAQPYPVPAAVAQTHDGQGTGHFWSALGVPPRLAFSLTVTIALPPEDEVADFAVVTGFDLRTAVLSRPPLKVRVLDARRSPVAGATVEVLGTPARGRTDALGTFRAGGLDFGTWTLRVRATGHADHQVSVTYAADQLAHDLVLAQP